MPPPTSRVCPVRKRESLDARKTVARATSSGVPQRPSGVDFTTPFRVTLQNGPTTADDSLWHHGAFLQDQVSIGSRLTLNVGARWDYYNAYEPEQDVREGPWRDFFYGGQPLQTSAGSYSIPASPFAGAWIVPERKDIIVLKNVAPRVGLSWDVRGDGKTVVKVNWGRFYFNPGVSFSDDVNPLQLTTATFGWADRNRDRKFELGELGPFVSLAGGARNTVEEGIKSAYTDEANVFFERQIIPNLGLRVGYVWKKQNNQWDLIDVARPFELWSVTRAATDPGVDGQRGTSDDGQVTAYDLAQVTTSRFEWQARDDYDQRYKNVDLTLSKRMSNRWSLVASYLFTWRNESWNGSPQNPNEALNNFTDDTIWTFKLFGTYQGPWGVNISPVLRHQSGANFAREISIPASAAPAGVFFPGITYYADEPMDHREDNIWVFDVRAEKTLNVTNRIRLRWFFDLFNITNSHASETVAHTTGASYLRPTAILAPRTARVGVRFLW